MTRPTTLPPYDGIGVGTRGLGPGALRQGDHADREQRRESRAGDEAEN